MRILTKIKASILFWDHSEPISVKNSHKNKRLSDKYIQVTRRKMGFKRFCMKIAVIHN